MTQQLPNGSHVSLKKDDGTIIVTKTRSDPFLMGTDHLVVLLDGISGAYPIDKITILPTSPGDHAQPIGGGRSIMAKTRGNFKVEG